jgi:hypothetical protein
MLKNYPEAWIDGLLIGEIEPLLPWTRTRPDGTEITVGVPVFRREVLPRRVEKMRPTIETVLRERPR